jgi:hypothetical protein
MTGEGARQRIDLNAEGVLAALRRARLRAERVALMTGTHLIQAVDGKPVRVTPRPTAQAEVKTIPDASLDAPIALGDAVNGPLKPSQ